MSRLIDADALIIRLRNESVIPFSKMLLKDEHRWFLKLEDMIKTQPTAYDVEKVVAELEEEVKYQDKKADEAGVFDTVSKSHARISMRKCYEHAIEIVRKGGVE